MVIRVKIFIQIYATLSSHHQEPADSGELLKHFDTAAETLQGGPEISLGGLFEEQCPAGSGRSGIWLCTTFSHASYNL